MTHTFDAYKQFDPRRAERLAGLEQACEVMDSLPCSDLTSLLTIMSDVRGAGVTAKSVVEGNRFHEPSAVSQRDYHWIEGLIIDAYDEDVDIVELSPLQPFGTNKLLADTNQKNVVSTARNSEANADIATALFRVAIDRFTDQSDTNSSVTVASNTRLVRAQMYKNPKFLPHFRMFGEVTVGGHDEELQYMADHVGSKFDIVSTIANSDRSLITAVDIKIGNLALLNDLVRQGRVDADDLRRNIRNPDYDFIAEHSLDIPEFLPLDTADLGDTLRDLGFERGVGVTQNMKRALEETRPDLIPNAQLHLGRTSSNGYYKHICFEVDASSAGGETSAVAGGGSTDWAVKAGQKKGIATVVSTISTDQICRSFII